MISLQVWLSLSAVLFCIGVYGALSHRNAIGLLVSIELMANAVNLNFVAFAAYSAGVTGHVFALFAIALTVVEVVVGLAIVVLLYRSTDDVVIDGARELRG